MLCFSQEAARTRCVELQNIRVEMHRMQLQQEAREQEVAFINQTEDERLRALKVNSGVIVASMTCR